MKTLTLRQKEIVDRIEKDRKLNAEKLSPKGWLSAKRTQLRLSDLTKMLRGAVP